MTWKVSKNEIKGRFADKWQKGQKLRPFYAKNKDTSQKMRMVGLREMSV